MTPDRARLLALLLGYLLGSIPFGLLLTRAGGAGDIRAVGSGNIGATNVLRTGRRGLALATLLLDAAKGVAAVLAAGALLGAATTPLAGAGAVVGHVFPVWLGFRGGKGVATGLGVFWAIDWPIGLAASAAWVLVAALTRISSAGALAAFATAPVAALASGHTLRGIACGAVALLVCARHEANIRRLLAGTEPRIGRAR